MENRYDIIVIGGGHAGSEAAAAAGKMGSKVLLVTMDMTKIAQMSCNPAMGGIAKGQMVREIDALGGFSGMVTDKSMIQFRMLNRSKGPAMWSPRAQCDRIKFSWEWRRYLETIENVDFWQDMAEEIIIKGGKVQGIKTKMGVEFRGKAVILTAGTFMNGLMHIGKTKIEGGRAAEQHSKGISEILKNHGFEAGRMKTGTPARVDGRTIEFDKLTEQKGDEKAYCFSFMNEPVKIKNQRSCYITHTDLNVHEIIENGLEDSPLFNGTIKSIGPRYCPSIEDKIVTFAEKERHQLFIEPEGKDTIEYYINGFSSSLPWDVQFNAMRRIRGLENVKIFRPGYAIEYDYFKPTQLKHTLETKKIDGLYLAGQVNGTTGYEEAGAQGLIAGINAHLKMEEKEELILGRDQAYIGVLIDDLVTKGVDEPYRMFTSRAEYRILLRQDDADLRLTEIGYRIGLASGKRLERMREKYEWRNGILDFIRNHSVKPEEVNGKLKELGTAKIRQGVKLKDLIIRPQVKIDDMYEEVVELRRIMEKIPNRQEEISESAEIELKYEGYINREKQLAAKLKRMEHIRIPENFEYMKLGSISTEARQKLTKIKPRNIGQASRISGVSPSDISVLLIYLGR
ncbi:MAG: tRNA uridine-5-carboxymethylaminomethyl(34) synthesis enzyme MnmG [Bacteroidales bacterium]|nr:MAG: tRNA uridine-5-carboxymethylaminomethyl(34) synthesis enzyme MnmG [Bacteroidales bacterium]